MRSRLNPGQPLDHLDDGRVVEFAATLGQQRAEQFMRQCRGRQGHFEIARSVKDDIEILVMELAFESRLEVTLDRTRPRERP